MINLTIINLVTVNYSRLKMNPTFSRFLLILFIALLNVGCDQQTKVLAVEHLQGEPVLYYLGDTFRLLFAENTGAFLSIGSDLPANVRLWVLNIIPLVVLIGVLCYTVFAQSLTRWHLIALSCVIGGGFSNIADRIAYGKVVDFMNMGIGSLRTGIFNFADVSIMAGMGILLFLSFRE